MIPNLNSNLPKLPKFSNQVEKYCLFYQKSVKSTDASVIYNIKFEYS